MARGPELNRTMCVRSGKRVTVREMHGEAAERPHSEGTNHRSGFSFDNCSGWPKSRGPRGSDCRENYLGESYARTCSDVSSSFPPFEHRCGSRVDWLHGLGTRK